MSQDQWDGITLEAWVERSLREGNISTVAALINSLPVSQKEKYREIYKRVLKEKNELSKVRSQENAE